VCYLSTLLRLCCCSKGIVDSGVRGRGRGATVKTEIIGHHAGTLELPLLASLLSQVRAEGESSRCVLSS